MARIKTITGEFVNHTKVTIFTTPNGENTFTVKSESNKLYVETNTGGWLSISEMLKNWQPIALEWKK